MGKESLVKKYYKHVYDDMKESKMKPSGTYSIEDLTDKCLADGGGP